MSVDAVTAVQAAAAEERAAALAAAEERADAEREVALEVAAGAPRAVVRSAS